LWAPALCEEDREVVEVVRSGNEGRLTGDGASCEGISRKAALHSRVPVYRQQSRQRQGWAETCWEAVIELAYAGKQGRRRIFAKVTRCCRIRITIDRRSKRRQDQGPLHSSES